MRIELLATRFRALIDRLPVVVGRNPAADVRLPDPRISRYHCRIEQRNGVVLIRDSGSTNGTFVNGCRVAETELNSGDLVTLGDTRFLVLYPRGAEAETEPQPASGIHRSIPPCRSDGSSPALPEGTPDAASGEYTPAKVPEA